ncbi:hypothetical protein [Nibricoccus sp. IMCC34717]|uniref:hypothetical protein n=1 Tax=Nibricoccus sp. IMCC34717 TaxID=3034021 RepID=UPI00384D8BD7
MAPRLLSIITLLEGALRDREAPAMAQTPSRLISFHRGIGRLIFADKSGDIAIQTFSLADGQMCIKLQVRWTGTTATVTHALYPQGNFQWDERIGSVADSWCEGPPPSPVLVDEGAVLEAV